MLTNDEKAVVAEMAASLMTPVELENALARHPRIAASIAAGALRNQMQEKPTAAPVAIPEPEPAPAPEPPPAPAPKKGKK